MSYWQHHIQLQFIGSRSATYMEVSLAYFVIDEATRHSISKMAHLHFVANKTIKKVIQLGEKPSNVYNVGEWCGCYR